MSDRIEKRIELKAPVSRVWRALTDYREFGQWFRVNLEGPFVPGQISRGQMTYPGYEHVRWEATVQKMDHERLFSLPGPIPSLLAREISLSIIPASRPPWSNSGWKKPPRAPCWCSPNPDSTSFPRTAGSMPSAETRAAGPCR